MANFILVIRYNQKIPLEKLKEELCITTRKGGRGDDTLQSNLYVRVNGRDLTVVCGEMKITDSNHICVTISKHTYSATMHTNSRLCIPTTDAK